MQHYCKYMSIDHKLHLEVEYLLDLFIIWPSLTPKVKIYIQFHGPACILLFIHGELEFRAS